jgi:hypothetical protein
MTDDGGGLRVLHPYPGMAWTEVRAAAVDFAEHGWSVLPGTFTLDGHDGWLGKKSGSVGMEPISDSWTTEATTDTDTVLDMWTRRPYSILLLCGNGVDVLQVPETYVQRGIDQLRRSQQLGPIASTPFGTSLLFVKAGTFIKPEVATEFHGRLLGSGSWVALPPTTHGPLPYRWRISPASVNWVLPSGSGVQQAITGALSTHGYRRTRAVSAS